MKGFFQGAQASLNPYVAAGMFKPYDDSGELMPGIRAVVTRGHTQEDMDTAIELLKTYLPTTFHLSAGVVSAKCTSWATSTTMMAAETHRQGWRTGTARIASGRPSVSLD